MTFDKEEVLKTLYEDLAYNEFTYDQDYGPDMVDMPFHELDKRLKELVTQAYEAGRREERERIALEVACYAQLSVDETKYLLKIIKEED